MSGGSSPAIPSTCPGTETAYIFGKSTVNQFFEAVEQNDLKKAYGIWFHDPNWQQHPAQYSQYNLVTEDVRAALIERLESGKTFEEPSRPDRQVALTAIPREQHEEILAANERALELAIAERDSLERMLQSERDAFKQERVEMRTEWQTEIAKLNRRIGRLEQKVLELGGDPDLE